MMIHIPKCGAVSMISTTELRARSVPRWYATVSKRESRGREREKEEGVSELNALRGWLLLYSLSATIAGRPSHLQRYGFNLLRNPNSRVWIKSPAAVTYIFTCRCIFSVKSVHKSSSLARWMRKLLVRQKERGREKKKENAKNRRNGSKN